MGKMVWGGAIIALGLATQARAQSCGDEVAKLTRPDPQDSDFMGRSIGAGEHGIGVGAVQADGVGAVEIYRDGGQGWQHAQMLRPADIEPGDRFAEHCDMHGDVLVVGARWQQDELGAAYVYRFDGSSWQFEQKLLASDGATPDTFGSDVAVDGDRIVVGARRAGVGGAAYVFEFDGALWVETQRIDPSGAAQFDEFGVAVELSGDVIVVGAWLSDALALNAGAAYVYRFDGNAFVEEQVLLASDGAERDELGLSVGVDGRLIVVGAHEHDLQDEDEGAAYVFGFDGEQWVELQKLTASDAGRRHGFGYTTHIRDGRILASAPFNATGVAYVFDPVGTDAWSETGTLIPSDGENGDSFGWSIADGGAFSVIGAYSHDNGGFFQGAAYVYACEEVQDTDGDGLLDTWETDGIPFLADDGSQRLYVLDIDGDGVSDADPAHKDLFFELDRMQGLDIPQDAIDQVRFAFEAAPVDNPDGTPGIRLHVVRSHDTLPFEETSQMNADGWPVNAQQLRNDWFGTESERQDPDRQALLGAKSRAYRYVIVMNRMNTPFGFVGGVGEIGGDDIAIFAASCCNRGLSIDFASSLMHEMGHTLGLRHGGGDNINGKPNYPSVMNYSYSFSLDWSSDFWELDYSRDRLATLDEACLDETGYAGSTMYPDWFAPYYTTIPFNAPCWDEDDWGSVAIRYLSLDEDSQNDFDADCALIACASEDLNHIGPGGVPPGSADPSPDQMLRGHDDWANLQYAIESGGGAFVGEAPTADELTETQIQWMQVNFPPPPIDCAADIDDDGDLDSEDFFAYLDAFESGDVSICDIDGDGDCDAEDFFGYLDVFAAGC